MKLFYIIYVFISDAVFLPMSLHCYCWCKQNMLDCYLTLKASNWRISVYLFIPNNVYKTKGHFWKMFWQCIIINLIIKIAVHGELLQH